VAFTKPTDLCGAETSVKSPFYKNANISVYFFDCKLFLFSCELVYMHCLMVSNYGLITAEISALAMENKKI